MRFSDISPDTEYLSADDKLHGAYKAAASWLRNNYPREVTGLWHISSPADDGGLQAVIRYSQELTAAEYNEIHAALFGFVRQERLLDTAEADTYLSEYWIAPRDIYCIFDNDRSVANG